MEPMIFTWDEQRCLLHREPSSQKTTREENMRYAQMSTAIRGDDKAAADLARYEMAKLAFEERHWYTPCREIPGGKKPTFMYNTTPEAFTEVRNGIRLLQMSAGARDIKELMERSNEAQKASTFQSYALRVSTVEGYNSSCCGALLMCRSWLHELNADGDAAAIDEIKRMLLELYSIHRPETEPAKRRAQAVGMTKNLQWMSSAWRRLWGQP